jgi:protein tyrosine/serine phosphatase
MIRLGGRLAVPALAFLIAACQGPANPPPTDTTTGRAMAARIDDVEGILNFARIHPGLYRGAYPSAEGLRHLKSIGVRTVLNLRSHHSNREAVEAAGMASVEMKLQADLFGSEPPTEEQLKGFFELVLDPARQPVFLHCAHGKDRTGTMAALYRIEVDGWTPDEAIEEMQAFGYHDVYKDLIAFVRSYQPRGFRRPAR